MAWWIKKSNLGEEQNLTIRSIKNNLNHVHWVSGVAGTGKTTVLAALTQELRNDYPDATFHYLTYTHALKDLAISSFKEENVTGVHFLTHTKFLHDKSSTDFVFLDEVQDISVDDLNTIKGLTKHLIIAGDCAQTIYEQSATEPEIKKSVEPVQHMLIIIHRLTEFLAKIASSILPSKELLGAKPGNSLANTTARLIKFENAIQECIWTIEESLSRARPNKPSCILLTHHVCITFFIKNALKNFDLEKVIDSSHYENNSKESPNQKFNYGLINNLFERHNINIRYLGNNHGDLSEVPNKPMVYLMTYHSSKGLDFENVFIPQLNSNKQIVYKDVLSKKPENSDLDKRLLFVAVTRSRSNLFMTYCTNEPHPLVATLPNISQTKYEPNQKDDEDENEDFF